MYSKQSACGAQSAHHHHYGHRPMHVMFRRPKYNVPLNIIDKGDSYEVNVFATGFTKDEVTLTVENDLLHITGKKDLSGKENPTFVIQEFPIKHFERNVSLNGQVNIDNISAEFKDSVLVIKLQKSEEAKHSERRIEVK
jgi:HSP20 family protein